MLVLIESFYQLARVGYLMKRGGLPVLIEAVEASSRNSMCVREVSAEEVSSAIDKACILYPKAILCLQRSVACAIMLRRRGYPAELVIGAQVLPFKSHAWIELNGRVLNDREYVPALYQELVRN